MEHHSLSQVEFWKPFLRKIYRDCISQGITLKVRQRDRTLQLLLESQTPLSKTQWVTNIRGYLSSVSSSGLDPFRIQQVLIYGKSTETQYPSWKAVLAVPISPSSFSETASSIAFSESVLPPSQSSSESLLTQSSLTESLPSELPSQSPPSESLPSESSPSESSPTESLLSESLPSQLSPSELSLTESLPNQSQANSSPIPFHNKAMRLIRPAGLGMKDLLLPSTSDRLSDRLSDVAAPPNPTPNLWATEELSFLGSQGWIARSILGFFALSLIVYLYLGTWFIPQQSKQLNALQPEVTRLESLEPRNFAELTQLIEDLKAVIDQLQSLSWVSGVFYERAQDQAKSLNDRYDRLQQRLELEQLGQTYFATAKYLAAQATLNLERSPNPDLDLRRQIQQQWLAANYWLTLIPAQTFAAKEAQRLQGMYQKNYWHTAKPIAE